MTNIPGTFMGHPIIFDGMMSPSAPVIGQVRYNVSLRTMDIFNGTAWYNIGVYAPSVPEAKIYSEEELCAMHPGLLQLKKDLEIAQDKYNAYLALVRK